MIQFGLLQNSWMPHQDTVINEIYPIPEEEGEGGSGQDMYLLVAKNQNIKKKEPQGLIKIWNNPPEEDKSQEVVLDLLEEEVGKTPVIQVEMMVQTEMKMHIQKKRMTAASLLLG